jgi:hypothetical protein
VRLGKLPMVRRTSFAGAAISTNGSLLRILRRNKHVTADLMPARKIFLAYL